MRLAIVTSGFLPVPASKGGAVETLCENFIKQNEIYKEVDLTIFSSYDEEAIKDAQEYNNTRFVFIKSNVIVDLLDKCIFFVAKNILKKKNSHSFRFIFRRIHFNNIVSKYIKKDTFDKILLENHTILYLALKFRKNYKKYKGRYYYHCHNSVPGKFMCSKIIENTNNIICVSKYRMNAFKKDLNIVKPQFSVVLNSIDPSIINRNIKDDEKEEMYIKYKLKSTDKILIYTGRFVPGKGIEEILSAVEKAKSQNIKLFVIGASLNALDVTNNFEQEILRKSEKIKDKVIFTGYINYQELYKYYAIADVAILPSIIEDSAPLTIIEAINCGLPIITTNSGGIPEYVNNKCAIILKRDENLIKNMTNAIDTLLLNEELRKTMKKESSRVANQLDLKKYYYNILKEMECI
jgi:spore coat protein SA